MRGLKGGKGTQEKKTTTENRSRKGNDANLPSTIEFDSRKAAPQKNLKIKGRQNRCRVGKVKVKKLRKVKKRFPRFPKEG